MEAKVHIVSDKVRYTERYIDTEYVYQTARAECQDGVIKVHPIDVSCQIRTQRQTPKLGVMLVGWGGNNGSTLTAAILANKLGLQWRTRSGIQHANYYGSLTQCSTIELCPGVQAPFSSVLPMVHPDDIALDGWDISGVNLYDSMVRAEVLDVQLQDQLKEYLVRLKPRPAVFDAGFVAANQESRADNLLRGTKQELLDQLRADIRNFRSSSAADSIVVVWTATTERFSSVRSGLNSSAAELVRSVLDDCEEISPSTLYGMASVLEGCAFINGAPQNTCVPGLIELAEQQGVYIAGDDFKSGQTKLKSVLVDFLISAGIKPVSIVSYNHLGNNDGLNLSAPQQFHSKEITKSGVVEDMVSSNSLLFGPDESPDHCIVIKYVPYVGDSKRAMDEYTSEIMCGGHNTIVVHNTCEDSLLAAPIILDLVILTELFQRVQFRLPGEEEYHGFNSVLSVLGYLCKAPLVPEAAPVVNALFRQRACIENLMRACVGLAPVNNINLEHKLPMLSAQRWNEIVVQNSTRQQPSGGVAWKHNGRVQNGVAPILPADANGIKQNGGNVRKQQKPENGSE